MSPKKKAVASKKTVKARLKNFLARRPHRSFRRTLRRDYARPSGLPRLFAFTAEVNKTLWRYKTTFTLLGIVYAILFAVLVGIGSQDTYTSFTEEIKGAGEELLGGDLNALGQAGLLFVSIATVGINNVPGEAQQVFTILLALMVWLTVVWLLRNLLAGHKVRLRDGLYNAGAPLFATMLIAGVIVVQLLPVLLAMIGYAAASASGLLAGGVEAMLFWLAAGLLGMLSLYWVTSSLIAGIVITLPGMYPMRALRLSGDMVLGRRVAILIRWVWMVLMLTVTWVAVLFPVILLDMGVKSLWPVVEWLPIIPVALLLLGTFSVVWIAAYVYLLYRKVVEGNEHPSK